MSEEVNAFNFIENPAKMRDLEKTNDLLNINKSNNNTLVFIYSLPKVGSTSLVSSLRLFGIEKMDIIHIHDEEMLKVLANITNVKINEIILYNKYLGKNVYVINIYRSPIERKISTFFEKIGGYHFNNEDDKVNNYNISRVIHRFNNIFPWIGNGDHFMDRYDIDIPEKFDHSKKYIMVNKNGINYISMRLKDSVNWGNILTTIFGFEIRTIKDYESSKKTIKDLYNTFKRNYKIPINFLNDQMNDKYLKYYYSEEELTNYYKEWIVKSSDEWTGYSAEQYILYEEITKENTYYDKIQLDHYFDEGCTCKACCIKRMETRTQLLKNISVTERIIHTEVKTQLIQKRINKATKINNIISKLPTKFRGKDFRGDMTSIVTRGNRL